MAENKQSSSLIGHDPLAWMSREEPDNSDIVGLADTDNTNSEAFPVQLMEAGSVVDNEIVENGNIVLDAVLNIRNVAALHERLLSALDSNQSIEIDASAVTAVDTATLQLLLVLKRTAIKLQKQVMIDFPSEKFIEASRLLGIAEMLEIDRAAAGFF